MPAQSSNHHCTYAGFVRRCQQASSKFGFTVYHMVGPYEENTSCNKRTLAIFRVVTWHQLVSVQRTDRHYVLSLVKQPYVLKVGDSFLNAGAAECSQVRKEWYSTICPFVRARSLHASAFPFRLRQTLNIFNRKRCVSRGSATETTLLKDIPLGSCLFRYSIVPHPSSCDHGIRTSNKNLSSYCLSTKNNQNLTIEDPTCQPTLSICSKF